MRHRMLTLAALALLTVADPALAAPTSSQVTAPGDPAYVLTDGSRLVTVTGSTTGSGNLDLDCYDASGARTTLAADETPAQLAAGVPVQPSPVAGMPCVLRAVPHGDSTARPPGGSDPFRGPRLLVTATTGSTVDAVELGGAMKLQPAAACAVGASRVVDPSSLAETGTLFTCAARPAVTVDGAAASSTATPSGVSEDPSSGDVRIDEADAYGAVVLRRTWMLDHQGRVADETDAWSSSDGAPHSLDAVYREQVSGGAFEFPGTSFSTYPPGATVQLPRGAGSVLIAAGAQGALTWASAPDDPARFATSDDVELPYRREIPARGALTLRFRLSQSSSLAEASAFAQAAVAAYQPQLTIGSPADGSTTDSASAIVTGTASDALGVASVAVNGDPVAVAPDGSWSAPVNFAPGRNTITAAVTNVDGTTVTRQIGVSYAPPSTLQGVSAPRISGNAVTVELRCSGSGTCRGVATLTTRATMRRRRIVRLAGRRTVTVGSRRFAIPAGHVERVVIPLDRAGRRLLRRFGKLPVRLSVGRALRSGTLTFRRRHR